MTNSLDEHIKEKLGDYSPDVPPHIWENIIAEKEKRRPAGFWFINKNLSLLLLGIVIVGTGILLFKNVYSPAATSINAKNEPVKTTGKSANNTSAEINNENLHSSSITTSTENPTNESSNTIVPAEKNFTTTGKNSPAANDKGNSLSPVAGNHKNDLTVRSSSDNNANGSIAITGKKQKNLKGTASMSYTSPGTVSDDLAEINENDLLMNRFLLSLDMIHSQKTFKAAVKKTTHPQFDIPCPNPEKDAAGNKRYFEIYGGPDYAFSKITDTANSTYLQRRKESTSFASAFSAGLRYTRVFNNGMSFRTGINYSQINEKFKFSQGNIIQTVYIIDNNGDTTGSYTATGTRYKTTYNKFRTIDIPMLIGYELGNGRIHANINAGAVINAYSWQKGDVLDTAYQPVNITTGKTASPYHFKTNVGIGFMGAVSVYYKLNDKWHILLEPYFRYNFSSASKSELTLKQKYNTAGLRLGIRLDF